MSKRTGGLERRQHDYYPSPYSVVPPILPYLEPRTRFIEPCAGDGRLIGYLQEHGHICEAAFDIAPLDPCIMPMDALNIQSTLPYETRTFITNPPWSRPILHRLIIHLSNMHPTILIFDADWAFTKQAAPYLDRCQLMITIGRVKWIEDSPHSGKDNVCAYKFDRDHRGGPRIRPRTTE
jgi:hypothetical protein